MNCDAQRFAQSRAPIMLAWNRTHSWDTNTDSRMSNQTIINTEQGGHTFARSKLSDGASKIPTVRAM
eukprot:8279180-Alexandrium_andersonii.AAC.1